MSCVKLGVVLGMLGDCWYGLTITFFILCLNDEIDPNSHIANSYSQVTEIRVRSIYTQQNNGNKC